MNVIAVVYNRFPNTDKMITKDSEKIIESRLNTYFPKATFVTVPEIDIENPPLIDFSQIKYNLS